MILPLHTAVAAHAHQHGMPITAAAVAEIDQLLAEERSRELKPERLGREVQGAAVHDHRMPEGGARHHVR